MTRKKPNAEAQTAPEAATDADIGTEASLETAPVAAAEADQVTDDAPPAVADEAEAAEPAPAVEVTATESEPEAPTAAAPASTEEDEGDEVETQDQDVGTTAAEAEAPAFIRFLEDEAKKAELAMQPEAHAWLLSLQQHLTGLKLHLERIPATVHEDFHELSENVKELF